MSKTDCMHIASAISGVYEVLISHPLDRLKTELQVMTLNNAKNNAIEKNPKLINGIKSIYDKNKIKGFYSGILPRLVGIIPMRLMYWSTMTISTEYTNNNNKLFNDKLNNYFNEDVSKLLIHMTPGIITGFIQSLIDNPIEVAKIKLMTGTSEVKINKLYQGFGYLLARNIIFAVPVAYSVKTYGKENSFLAGAIGGIIGSIISHPFDVLKTERQRNQINDNIKKITMRHLLINNPKSLFSGLLMRTSLSFINMGIGFSVFNFIYVNLYNTHNNDKL
jgi:hypothetical protein